MMKWPKGQLNEVLVSSKLMWLGCVWSMICWCQICCIIYSDGYCMKLMVQQFVMIENSKLSKRDQKHSKILQKELQDLHRQVQAMNRRSARNDNQSESENEFVDKKGKKWWSRFSQRYFAPVYKHQYLQLRQLTTTERVLQISPKEALSLSTYASERISADYDLFNQPGLIHVMYKSANPPFYALTSYQIQPNMPHYSQPHKDTAFPFKISPISPIQEMEEIQAKQIKLSLAAINDDNEFCEMVEKYKKTIGLFPDKNEVQRQILLWQKQLDATNRQNNRLWQSAISSIKREKEIAVDIDEDQFARIKDYLMWVTVLKYFQHGYQDKTMQMLQILIENEKMLRPTKSNEATKKKFFQTDCKICFCSFNNDSNQVLYCDSSCYGLTQIPKEEIYYCDCCRYQKKYNYKKVMCALCNKANFPIKQLNGHFYHATCLILLNLVQIKNSSLVLKQGKDHQQIIASVVQNQINQRECQFCTKLNGCQVGFRLQCQCCQNNAHPICAYINGCKYSMKRNDKNDQLEVKYTCNRHDENRDWIEQTYIRRYMCNLKKTSSKTIEEFRNEYELQMQKRQKNKVANRRWSFSNIISKTRFIKRIFQKQETRNQHNQKIDTQSGRILEKFKKKSK